MEAAVGLLLMFGVAHGEQPNFFFMQGFKNTYFILNFSTIRIRSEKKLLLSFVMLLHSDVAISYLDFRIASCITAAGRWLCLSG